MLFYNLGLIYRRNGLLDDARSAFARSDEINPRPIPGKTGALARDRLDELAVEQGRIAEIEGRLSGSIEVAASGSAGWHRRMAELLTREGELRAARGHLRRALENRQSRLPVPQSVLLPPTR